jgi:hypothetical protein
MPSLSLAVGAFRGQKAEISSAACAFREDASCGKVYD